MENTTKTTSASAHIPAPATEAASPITTDTAIFDEIATAMAEQGLFGKIKLGASLLLFGEVNLDKADKPH